MESEKVLIVDDEPAIRSALRMVLEYEGYSVAEAKDGLTALAAAAKELPDIVLLDIKMPGMDGMEVLEELRRRDPRLPVIMLSGHGTISTAVAAVKLGATDFLEKPPEQDRILLTIRNALQRSRLQQEVQTLRDELRERAAMIGDSPALQAIRDVIQRIARLNVSVLITGESGTGKELVARQLHLLSPRTGGPFVQVNCAAIPETLIENELFGHGKGAYTGAGIKGIGKFEQANNGTIFLDEVGDMSLATQAKVLRVLQDGEYQRVGGHEIRRTNARLIAATNKDLVKEIAAGRFREDLFYRLNVVPVKLPPLRDRREDVPALIEHFRRRFGRENGIAPAGFSDNAVTRLRAYHWPGNIRQLKNVVERSLILANGPTVTADDIELDQENAPPAGLPLGSDSAAEESGTLQEFKEDAERRYLLSKLAENNWNVKATAVALDTPRSNLYKRMKHLGIDPADHRNG